MTRAPARPPWKIAWPGDARRSLLLWGVGAILGLAAAGFSLFTAKGTQTSGVSPEYIATVNGRPLYVADFISQLQAEFNTPLSGSTAAQRRKVADEMIREELFVQRGLELDEPAVDTDVRTAITGAVQAQIAVDATAQTPTEGELRAFYAANQARYLSIGEMAVDDLVSRPGLDARAGAAALRGVSQAPASAARFGVVDTGAVKGDEFYFAARIHLGDRLFGLARTLAAGQVSPPTLGDDGRLHVLVMTKNERPTPRTFEEARNEVYADYREFLSRRIQDSEYKYLRRKADVQINRSYGR